jgi:hypothetical protein
VYLFALGVVSLLLAAAGLVLGRGSGNVGIKGIAVPGGWMTFLALAILALGSAVALILRVRGGRLAAAGVAGLFGGCFLFVTLLPWQVPHELEGDLVPAILAALSFATAAILVRQTVGSGKAGSL